MARGGGWLQLNMFSWVGLDNLMDTKYGEDRRQKRRSVMAETVWILSVAWQHAWEVRVSTCNGKKLIQNGVHMRTWSQQGVGRLITYRGVMLIVEGGDGVRQKIPLAERGGSRVSMQRASRILFQWEGEKYVVRARAQWYRGMRGTRHLLGITDGYLQWGWVGMGSRHSRSWRRLQRGMR
jgi:hypothetical protein